MKENAAQYLNQFLSDNTLDESIKALLEKNIKAFQIEHEKKLAEEANNEPVQQEIYEPVQQEIYEPEKPHIDYEIHGENPLYDIQGNRGRRLYVYEHKCIIQVDVTLGSVLTNNATDGEKTIYYKDVLGVQLKKEGLLIGYLQLETADAKGNNKNNNFFDENTFTFNKYEDVHQAYKYIISRLDEIKRV
jgi:hypothetical protein